MEDSKLQKRKPRLDKKHRFQLRIKQELHAEAEVICFKHPMSFNLFYTEAIDYALGSQGFMNYIANKYPQDDRKGYFTYTHTAQYRGRSF
ncbi:hypothetical protein [Chengkuizengella marina]|uniref:Uncharacterized protein n=1 Tax=Chengkuizengella marina TaxID=2507566 RepID=A0A6N9Q038_9BACL|nr:hypothetical protein [Chengkuizengella marina]NBI28617.1 hypothetical protein [Chengkuizengella marina]